MSNVIPLSEQMARRKFEKQVRALQEAAPLIAAVREEKRRRRNTRIATAALPFAFFVLVSILVWLFWGA